MNLNSLPDGLTFEILWLAETFSTSPYILHVKLSDLPEIYLLWSSMGTEEMFMIFGVVWNPRWASWIIWLDFVFQKIASRLQKCSTRSSIVKQKLQCTIASSCDPKGHVRYFHYLSSVSFLHSVFSEFEATDRNVHLMVLYNFCLFNSCWSEVKYTKETRGQKMSKLKEQCVFNLLL